MPGTSSRGRKASAVSDDMLDWVRGVLRTRQQTTNDKEARRTRWVNVAQHALETGPGDLVEIGALAGDTTVMLCKLAEQYGRQVVVVDPWEAPTHDVAGWERDVFEKRTERWQKLGILTIVERRSQDIPVIQMLLGRPWAFALVDGSHEYQDVLCDAMAVRKASVICFDDMDKAQVRKAFDRALALMPGRLGSYDSTLGRKWEGYIT